MKKTENYLGIADLKAHNYYRFEGAKVDYEMTIGTGLRKGRVYYVVGFSPNNDFIVLADKNSYCYPFILSYDSADKKFTKAETF